VDKVRTEYLSVPQAAELLQVDVRTVRAMIRRREISAARCGRVIRVTRESIERLFPPAIPPRTSVRLNIEGLTPTVPGAERVRLTKQQARRVG
jgi:excisionase family DNA binding protein